MKVLDVEVSHLLSGADFTICFQLNSALVVSVNHVLLDLESLFLKE